VVAVGTIVAIFLQSLYKAAPLTAKTLAPLQGGTIQLGELLLSNTCFPFEIVSILLLVAIVGVVLLSKKQLK